MSLCVPHVCSISRGQMKVSDPCNFKLESQLVVSHRVWLLETEPRSLARAVVLLATEPFFFSAFR